MSSSRSSSSSWSSAGRAASSSSRSRTRTRRSRSPSRRSSTPRGGRRSERHARSPGKAGSIAAATTRPRRIRAQRKEETWMTSGPEPSYGRSTAWRPERPHWRPFPLIVSWLATGVALMVAAAILPGVHIDDFWGALLIAAIVAALNAVIPPLLAALRLPLTLVLGFLLVLIADALILQIAGSADVTDGVFTVDNFGWALLAALVVAAVSVVLAVLLGSDDMGSIRTA